MKKLKIFLMLSILLCFGFMLSPEVHASGPKAFEVNDVLPATTQLKISWTSSLIDYTNSIDGTFIIQTSSWSKFRIEIYNKASGKRFKVDVNGISTYIFEDETFPNFISPYTDFGGIQPYIIIDISSLSEVDRTIKIADNIPLVWEDLNAPSGYSITFEENGGTSVTDLSEQTALPNPLPTPTKENYIFHGWYYDSDFTNRAFPGDPLTSDVTLYAKWGLPNSPKIFEVGDVLPAGEIKLSWDFTDKTIASDDTFYIKGTDGIDDYFIGIDEFGNIYLTIFGVDFPDVDLIGNVIITLDNEVTITEFGSDGKDYYEYIHGALFWEVVTSEDPYIIHDDLYNLYNGEALDIELGYILPASKIAINLVYNNTGGQDDGMIVYTFGTYGRIALTAFEDMSPYVYETQATINVIILDDNWNMNILHDSLADQTFGSTRGILSAGMIIDLTDASEEERTITEISISNISDTRIEMDCIFSRILSIDESIYQDGYLEGYSEGREIYGYYDPNTEQWLSVDEYLELYGEKMSSSNFYTNFDKYFIPAMIIVFGGAIVLTILKVFKGRE